MKKPNLFLKVAVLASALLLVGGLVSYRAGAFDWLMPPAETPPDAPIIGGTKSAKVFDHPPTGTESDQPSATPPAVIMGGSKSLSIGPIVGSPSSSPPTPPASDYLPATESSTPPSVIFDGSKSGIGIVPFPSKTPSPQPPAPTQPPPNSPAPSEPPKPPPTAILPSSKSGGVITIPSKPPNSQPPVPQQQAKPPQ